MSDAHQAPAATSEHKVGRAGRSGRKALIPLAAPPSLDATGRPVGDVARLFEEWLTERQASNRIHSAKTVDGYRDDMARWATLLTRDPPSWDRLELTDLTRDGLIAGLEAMSTAGLSMSARQRAMAPMRGLCRWLVRNGHLPRDPTDDVHLDFRPSPSRLPSAFTGDELARITAAVATGVGQQRAELRWPERDLAASALMAGAGLRASEVCDLPWSGLTDLDDDEPAVRVIGTRGRERIVPLGPHTAATIRTYRDQRRSVPGSVLEVRPDSAVIVRTDGRTITPSVLNSWVSHWLNAADVAPRPGALTHAFRHTAADGWLANGAALAEVQALLGHASIATTGIYAKVRAEALGDVVKTGHFESTQ